MIQRINFIEKAPFEFTYRRLVVIGGAIVGFLFLLYGLELTRVLWLGRKVVRITEEVTQLKVAREKQLKELTSSSEGSTNVQEALLKELILPPTWSMILKELTGSLPPSLWLTSIKSYEKAEVASKRGILLNGQAEEAAAVTVFIKKLEESPKFENVVLTSSKEESGRNGRLYQFAIDLVISRGAT